MRHPVLPRPAPRRAGLLPVPWIQPGRKDAMTALIPITNTPRDYAWGTVDGVAHALGWPGTGGPEAELWLGAHPLSPSRRADAATGAAGQASASAASGEWVDLAQWEEQAGTPLPFLLKVLSASSPLSLQAHPTPAQAAEGFAREEDAGIPLTARERNYKDPHAKPELIVAVDDGFEALCGFAPIAHVLAIADALSSASRLAERGDGREQAIDAFDVWRHHIVAGVRDAFGWLLSDDPDVAVLVAASTRAAAAHPRRFDLLDRLSRQYPGDPGVLVAQMLNRVTLKAGEALWLPAGNIHAYLRGTGVELMGPSDNVLRGGLTPKHVDRDELQKVLDFTPGDATRLQPVEVSEGVIAYRPASVPSGEGVGFELLLATLDATFATGSAAVAVCVEGAFTLRADGAGDTASLSRGDILFIDAPDTLHVAGAGRLFLATGL